MNLSEIEQKAQEYLAELLYTDSDAAASSLLYRLQGLQHVAQIIQVGDGRIARTADLELKEQALAAMNPQSGPCHAEAPMGRIGGGAIFCQLQAGHLGGHLSDDESGRAVWPAGESAEPTKPAADQLHELLSYLVQQSQLSLEKSEHVMVETPVWRKHLAASKAYDDAAQKLQDILTEGGI